MYFSHASSLISSEGLVLSWSVRHFPSKICWQMLSFLLELHWFQLHLREENKVHQQLLHFAKHQTPLVQFCPKFRQPTLNDISQSFLCQIADFYDLTPFFFVDIIQVCDLPMESRAGWCSASRCHQSSAPQPAGYGRGPYVQADTTTTACGPCWRECLEWLFQR